MNLLKKTGAAGLCLILASHIALAQFRDAGSKIRGEAMAGHEVRTYQRHAQDRSEILYYHSQSQKPIPKEQSDELVTGIRKDLKASDAALAKLKAEHPRDAEVLKQIAIIEKHHAAAHAACSTAEDECLKEHGEQAMIGECCSNMWHELEAAQSETAKLLKMLKIEKLEPPKKVEPKPKTKP